jgi:hypothetical protein
MNCPCCQFSHIRKNEKKEVNRITYVSIMVASLLITTNHQELTVVRAKKMSLNGMGFRSIERVKGVHQSATPDFVLACMVAMMKNILQVLQSSEFYVTSSLPKWF